MSSLQRILSKVQRSLDDETFTKIRRAELVDIINDAIYEVGNTVRLWVETIKIIPYPSAEDYTVAAETDLAALSASEGQTALVTETGERWRYRNADWEPYPYHIVKIDPEVTTIYRTTQVRRNGLVATEVSLQAANTAIGTGYMFPSTNDELRNLSGTSFAAIRREDNGYDLHFTREFVLGEECVVTYLKEQPYAPTYWNQAITIPSTVADFVECSATFRCMEKLYMQGRVEYADRMAYLKAKTEQELVKADAYLRNILDENSVIKTRPIKWLPEARR
jgi:hypothetical protein